MKYIAFIVYTAVIVLILIVAGCAFTPVFHNTANTELQKLSETLTDTKLEDLFRQHPVLILVKSTDIGNGNTRHEFTYKIIEKEDVSQRPATANQLRLYEKHTTFSINIFVNASGVIYEVLKPVVRDSEVILSYEKVDRWKTPKKSRDKTQSLPYP